MRYVRIYDLVSVDSHLVATGLGLPVRCCWLKSHLTPRVPECHVEKRTYEQQYTVQPVLHATRLQYEYFNMLVRSAGAGTELCCITTGGMYTYQYKLDVSHLPQKRLETRGCLEEHGQHLRHEDPVVPDRHAPCDDERADRRPRC